MKTGTIKFTIKKVADASLYGKGYEYMACARMGGGGKKACETGDTSRVALSHALARLGRSVAGGVKKGLSGYRKKRRR